MAADAHAAADRAGRVGVRRRAHLDRHQGDPARLVVLRARRVVLSAPFPGGPSGWLDDPTTAQRTAMAPDAVATDIGPTTWTGQALVVINGGGTIGGPNGTAILRPGDGAAYDPATNSWTSLPRSPILDLSDVSAVWTGNEVARHRRPTGQPLRAGGSTRGGRFTRFVSRVGIAGRRLGWRVGRAGLPVSRGCRFRSLIIGLAAVALLGSACSSAT